MYAAYSRHGIAGRPPPVYIDVILEYFVYEDACAVEELVNRTVAGLQAAAGLPQAGKTGRMSKLFANATASSSGFGLAVPGVQPGRHRRSNRRIRGGAMKIGIIGSDVIQKSKLASMLSKALKTPLVNNKILLISDSIDALLESLVQINREERGCQSFVTYITPCDCYVYYLYGLTNGTIDRQEKARVDNAFRNACRRQRYDLMVRVPPLSSLPMILYMEKLIEWKVLPLIKQEVFLLHGSTDTQFRFVNEHFVPTV